ncbi:MAG: glycosyltransferase [Chitinophagaceae bacterium]
MKPIPVLVITDSLKLGGTESVAVNIANDLSEDPRFEVFLVCSRAEGELLDRIKPGVVYFNLQKKRQLDLKAIWRLHRFIKKHRIEIVHAHSTSMYFPVLIKLFHHYKLVWHDHFGLVLPPSGKRFYPYISVSPFFDFAIAVNEQLLKSNRKYLHVKPENQIFLPNYSVRIESTTPPPLAGDKNSRVVCLANIRPQKDHLNLMAAFKMVLEEIPEATLYCVGVCAADEYEQSVRTYVKENALENHVFLTGAVANPFDYLSQCSVGVLSSESEGMPLSLIEYGLASLPVVCTDVGECAVVLAQGKNGILVPRHDAEALAQGIKSLINDRQTATQYAVSFKAFIAAHYSKEAIIEKLTTIYLKLLNKL